MSSLAILVFWLKGRGEGGGGIANGGSKKMASVLSLLDYVLYGINFAWNTEIKIE